LALALLSNASAGLRSIAFELMQYHFEIEAQNFDASVLRARRRKDERVALRGQRAAGKISRKSFFY
jgi:hypothetical protein